MKETDIFQESKAVYIENLQCYTNFNTYEIEVERVPFVKYVLKEAVHGENVYYSSKVGDILVPRSVIDKIRKQSYTEEDVIKWVTTNDDWDFFPAPDETRSTVIPLLRGDFIEKALKLKKVDVISGEELYTKYPIGNWEQQGDTLVHPEDGITQVAYGDLDPVMKIRIRANLYYELLSGEVKLGSDKVPIKLLKMHNASFYEESQLFHVEMVDTECMTVIEALEFRNYTRFLPHRIA